ncbi:hypothetical protein PT111_09075, partial [Erysipelothrix rhusiopathiae]|nr:hypothetical protein [Erysipelothrix rhusiopathiae]
FEVPYTDTSVLNDDESRGATLTLVTCTEANDYSVNRTIIKADRNTFESYLKVRKEVFVNEQNIDPKEEYDALDTLENNSVA